MLQLHRDRVVALERLQALPADAGEEVVGFGRAARIEAAERAALEPLETIAVIAEAMVRQR